MHVNKSHRSADRDATENAMQTRISHHFKLFPDTNILTSGQLKSVSLLIGSPRDGVELDIEFSPCHLPDLRELILRLEALQTMQRQKDEAASAVELAEKGVVPA